MPKCYRFARRGAKGSWNGAETRGWWGCCGRCTASMRGTETRGESPFPTRRRDTVLLQNTAGTARKELERCPWVIKDHSTESLPGIGDHQQATSFAIVSAPGIPGQPPRSSAAATAVIYFVVEHRAPAQQSMPSEQGYISGQHNRTWLMISSDNSYLQLRTPHQSPSWPSQSRRGPIQSSEVLLTLLCNAHQNLAGSRPANCSPLSPVLARDSPPL
jgi:hypothetical protein